MQKIKVAAVSTRNWIGQPEKSIKNMARWARRAAEQGAELIVFPELGVSGYVHHKIVWELAEPIPGPSTEVLATLARELDTVLCFGILEKDADIVYNTQVLVNAEGMIGKQRKIHMPGGEYLYWRSGFEIATFNIGKARVGITICYDSLFSELARSLYFKGAEVLIMPFAYETGGPRSRFAEEHITGLCYRTTCYSNGCYGIVCNNAGTRRKSKWEPEGKKFPGWAGVFSPQGEVVAFTREKGNGEAMATAILDPAKVAERRSSTCFIPRCLRPEIYTQIADSDQTGKH
jgi:predicted amidohydrolase